MNSVSRPLLTVIIAGVFFLGGGCGLLLQRNMGLGNLLRAAGIWTPEADAETWPMQTRPAPGLPRGFQGQLALFVLAGQSNMSGWGDLPEQQTLHPRAFVFGNDYMWRPASEPIDDPRGQVDQVSLGSGRMGPGMAFATTLLQAEPELVVGLIPCAKGDTSIHQWQRSLGDDTLYGSCLKRIAAASTMGDLAAVLFFQGEADALDPQKFSERVLSAESYGEMFARYIEDLRADLRQPDLPVVFAQIGSHSAPQDFVNWDLVKAEQAALDLPCTRMITTDDLPLMDAVHFTSASYQKIGERFAAAYLALMASEACAG